MKKTITKRGIRDVDIKILEGFLALSTVMASVSALINTKYLLKVAVDREEPKLMKLVEKILAGTIEEKEFLNARIQAGNRLKEKSYETVSIVSHDGEILVGHWLPAETPKRIMIAVHGWRDTWFHAFGLVADDWSESGCSILFIEQRASQSSGGDTISFGLMERFDCLDWIHWVNRRFGEDLPIYLCGVSMGASTVLMATGQELPGNVHGVIADCGYTSPHAIWKHVAKNNLHIAFGIRGKIADEILKQRIQIGSNDYSTVTALQSNHVPVLFIHGTDDHLVPVEMTYENYKACAGPKELLIVPGADHAMSYYAERDKYKDVLLRFWEKYDP